MAQFQTTLNSSSPVLPDAASVSLEPFLSVLLGLAAGWQWRGLGRILAPALEPSASAEALLISAILFALGAGPWAAVKILRPMLARLRRSLDAKARGRMISPEHADLLRRSAIAGMCA